MFSDSFGAVPEAPEVEAKRVVAQRTVDLDLQPHWFNRWSVTLPRNMVGRLYHSWGVPYITIIYLYYVQCI